ncbi:Holliday junction branch migration protein RuvA [Thermoactinomyces mirandus]|uniref:Holliday junction branch migration complex subunit RuvA n=1 Tax=Thermoactinomyces mirandus TaxID=2756294 RepID=A0A7W1XPK8_9BACL|nr:Holliday junction branch migration protein RuvA [Thermoactinomyces mirandus]MBA4600836.1 Holliday junction branch migration protein RuvA [Thermoactinomyces mirandus]
MIDFVKGKVHYQETGYLAVDVGGIGYQVYVTNPLAWEKESEIFLYTHLVVREDAQLLYGFPSKQERDLFRLLLEVSGIGPKAAMGMLAAIQPNQLVQAIQMEDLKSLTRLPGVGKKTAQRLVLDLKDKLKKISDFDFVAMQPSVAQICPDRKRDVIEALMTLGYNEEEAKWAVLEVAKIAEEEYDTETWIKQALKMIMNK